MNIVILTNDNFFSFAVLRKLLERRKNDIALIVFSSALIGKKGLFASILWSLRNTGLRHTFFKLAVYGTFKAMTVISRLIPLIPNRYSSYLWAKSNNIPYIRASNINDQQTVSRIKAANPDLIVSVSMNQIVKKHILAVPQQGCINVHCAPLPRYGGMSPYVWVLANNEDTFAVTIHYMDEGLDTGDIIVQEKVNILKQDSAFSLFFRSCLLASTLLIKVVGDIENNEVTSYPQDLTAKTYFSWPTKKCVTDLRNNGYTLARLSDFTHAIFRNSPRI